MELNLVQLWLMLQRTIRKSEAEGVVILDYDDYNAIVSKLDVVLNEAGVSIEARKQPMPGD